MEQSQQTLAALVGRVDRLERANRRWRAAAVGLGLLGVAAAAPSAVAPVDEVRTKKLTLLDAHGNPAAVLSRNEGVPSGLMFVDPANPKAVVALYGWGADGSGLMMINTKDGRRVVLHTGAVSDKGVPLENVLKAAEEMRHATLP